MRNISGYLTFEMPKDLMCRWEELKRFEGFHHRELMDWNVIKLVLWGET